MTLICRGVKPRDRCDSADYHAILSTGNAVNSRSALNSVEQESPANADKPARLKRMQKLLQFDVFRFISPNSIYQNFKFSMHSFTRYV